MPDASTLVKERPIPFKPEMVQAIRAGTKTQTRRIVNPQPPSTRRSKTPWASVEDLIASCPYGKPGDRLYVKEALIKKPSAYQPDGGIAYAADGLFVFGGPGFIDTGTRPDGSRHVQGGPWPWKVKHLTARYMPRWASRITLEITDVRVERVQSISEADATAEGFPGNIIDGKCVPWSAYGWFLATWQVINGKASLDANPWVWAITFKKVEAKCK